MRQFTCAILPLLYALREQLKESYYFPFLVLLMTQRYVLERQAIFVQSEMAEYYLVKQITLLHDTVRLHWTLVRFVVLQFSSLRFSQCEKKPMKGENVRRTLTHYLIQNGENGLWVWKHPETKSALRAHHTWIHRTRQGCSKNSLEAHL